MRSYQVIENKYGQQAVIDSDTKKPVSGWWDWIYIQSKISEYYIAKNHSNQYAIFHINNPAQPISQWWDWIELLGLSTEQLEYYIVKNQNGKRAIFHISDPYKPISQWWDWIETCGLIKGQSAYYIVKNQNDGYAIFHRNHPNIPISQWWHAIIREDGLIKGESDYYIVIDNWKHAIFHRNYPNIPISQWWDYIEPYGLVKGQSDYYIVQNHNLKYALFYKDNLDEPIAHWHDYIYPCGLINNTSECYAVIDKEASAIQIYHPDDISQPLYMLNKVNRKLLLYFDDKVALYLTTKYLMMYDAITMKHNIIGPLSEKMQKIIHKLSRRYTTYNIDINITSQLIADYMQHNFLPIVCNDTENYYCYLYTADGNYIGRFSNTQDMIDYIQQEIAKTNKNPSYDMLRLY